MSRPYRKAAAWARLGPLIGGAMLLLIGGAMLADELGHDLPNRWVALFLLLPAGTAIVDSLRLVWEQGHLGILVLARAIAGILFAAIGIPLFPRISTGALLPILIVALGVGAILRAIFAKH